MRRHLLMSVVLVSTTGHVEGGRGQYQGEHVPFEDDAQDDGDYHAQQEMKDVLFHSDGFKRGLSVIDQSGLGVLATISSPLILGQMK